MSKMKLNALIFSVFLSTAAGFFVSNEAILKILNDKTISNEQLEQLREIIQTNLAHRDANDSEDPDLTRNVTELIASKGYQFEEHTVQTKDGYILGVQRIPRGINEVPSNVAKPAIYLHHGLCGSASQWVLDFPHQSLAFILADAGYDVWLGNARGTMYSQKHVKYTPKDKEFWEFSWDEIALQDFPAVVDYILANTGQKKLSYVGHSMGTTIAFAMLSELPEYNDKIKAVIALAPVANLTYMTSPIKLLVPFSHEVQFLLDIFGEYEFTIPGPLKNFVVDVVCGPKHLRAECENIFFLFSGVESQQLNETRIPVYLRKFPDGTSTYQTIQYAQVISDKQFHKFDFGKKKNLEKYGQETPPIYQVEKITTPIALYYGLNDELADPADVFQLKTKIKNLIEFYQVPLPAWTHIDFAIGLDAHKILYPNVLSVLKPFN